MNAKFPCLTCSIDQSCDNECAPYVNYFRRLIKSYGKHGRRSLLMKHARKQLHFKDIYRITNCLNHFRNIKVTHIPSGNFYVIGRSGRILESGNG